MSGCGLCERELAGDAAGCYLCPGCARGTGERLGALPGLYEALRAFMQPGSRTPGLAPAVVQPGARLPVAEPALDLRGPGGAVSVLEDWRSALHADLGWTEPRIHGSYEQRLARAVKGLFDNLLWIASSWPMAGAMAEEVRDLHRDITSIVDPPDPRDRGRRIGYCVAAYEDGAICSAVIRAYPGEKTLTCRWCGCAYGPDDWLTLASYQPEEAEAS